MTKQVWAEAITFGDLLHRTAETYPDRPALVFEGEGVTYRELVKRVGDVAAGLTASGIKPGDHVGILMPNSIDFMTIFYAAAAIGAVTVPINARFKTQELGYVIDNADVRVLFTSDEISDHVDFPAILEQTFRDLSTANAHDLSLARAPKLGSIVLVGRTRPGFVPMTDYLHRGAEVSPEALRELRERVRLRDTALLMYTSGTTANPKGCLLTHESVVRNGTNFARVKFEMDETDRMWNPLPFFHMGALLPFTACVSAGSSMHSTRHFDPKRALRTLSDERITIAYPAFETIWKAVLMEPDFASSDLSALRIVMNTAVPESLRAMQEQVPWASQVAAFGSTEGSGTCCYNHPDDSLEDRIHTGGTPFPGIQVKAVDPLTGDDSRPGERGELWFKGYSVFEGYYKDAEQTAEALTSDGWFKSGDLGTVDEKGQVSFQGRLKDMLKIGGENVAAVEIENFLSTHPSVALVAVVSAPDDKYTEVAAAFVQLREGAAATAEELIEYCEGKIASFKIPRHVRFVETWPMSGTKIKKYRLRELIAEDLLTP